ncbi:MAG TPA: hypothetical protein EYO13_01510 [Candidatus Marinimicrobia bacterium]|nr:hypothetical protein [Candidatus Neomarinimicrobiota bacterium]
MAVTYPIIKNYIFLFFFFIALNSLYPAKSVAVLHFTGEGLSSSAARVQSDRFRFVLSKIAPFNVKGSGQSLQYDILNKDSTLYEKCYDLECAVKTGRLVAAQRVVMGSISRENNQFQLEAALVSVEMEEILRIRERIFEGELDKLETEIDSLVLDLFDEEINPEIYASRFLITDEGLVPTEILDDDEFKIRYINHRLRAMLLSAAMPGAGQIYSERKNAGYGFMGTWGVLGVLLGYNYYMYSTAKNNANELHTKYKNSVEPEWVLQYRADVIVEEKAMHRHNDNMKVLRNMCYLMWTANMVHTWRVAPETTIILGTDVDDEKVGINISIPLD